MKFFLLSLGCVRNLVDSEYIETSLLKAGLKYSKTPEDAEIIIVNSCGFIKDAVTESLDETFKLAELKKTAKCKKLILAGCLPQRFPKTLVKEIPEVDVFVGTSFYNQFPEIVKLKQKEWFKDPNSAYLHTHQDERFLSFKHLAYLKIAEGCNKHCTYCIIPKLRGRQRSRQINDIENEAKYLISLGIKEICLVAQDTTNYGKDLKNGSNLTKLLEKLSQLNSKVWFKVLYGNPDSIEDSFIDLVSSSPNIAPYFDLPIQHSSNKILKLMGRQYTQENLDALFDKIKQKIPSAVFRTTIMVGFPEETNEDFENLLTYIKKRKFNHLGAFIYSDQKDLPSSILKNKISSSTAQLRIDKIMTEQKKISQKNNEQYLNKELTCLIERKLKPNLYLGRTIFQAPTVDGITIVHSTNNLRILGSFRKVKVIKTYEYDLEAKSLL